MSSPTERSPQELLMEARERLAQQLGGQWAVALAAQKAALADKTTDKITSQRQISSERAQINQALVNLGMLAADSEEHYRPTFVR